MTQRSKEQAIKQVKEQGAQNDNPGARSTKNDKKEHGAEENCKKEHGARGELLKGARSTQK